MVSRMILLESKGTFNRKTLYLNRELFYAKNMSDNEDKDVECSISTILHCLCKTKMQTIPTAALIQNIKNYVYKVKSQSMTVVCLNIWRGKILLCKILLQCAA